MNQFADKFGFTLYLWRKSCALAMGGRLVPSGIINYFFYRFHNMGVACGPGFPFQVLALSAHNAGPRCGLSSAIPNAALAMPDKRPVFHRDFPGGYPQ